jgi:hypothetical protein
MKITTSRDQLLDATRLLQSYVSRSNSNPYYHIAATEEAIWMFAMDNMASFAALRCPGIIYDTGIVAIGAELRNTLTLAKPGEITLEGHMDGSSPEAHKASSLKLYGADRFRVRLGLLNSSVAHLLGAAKEKIDTMDFTFDCDANKAELLRVTRLSQSFDSHPTSKMRWVILEARDESLFASTQQSERGGLEELQIPSDIREDKGKVVLQPHLMQRMLSFGDEDQVRILTGMDPGVGVLMNDSTEDWWTYTAKVTIPGE